MRADVRRWGNSLAIRIPASEAAALELKEGDEVKVQLKKVPKGKIDVSGAPFFSDKEVTSGNVKEWAARARDEYFEEKRRRSL